MQNQLNKEKYRAIVMNIYDDLSECLKIFKINVNSMRKSILSQTMITWNPEAEQTQLNTKKNSLVLKYYNISYKDEGLQLILHRFLCRVKQVIDNQVSKIVTNSSVNLIRWIKYIKNSLFRQGYPQQTSIGKIMQVLLFPLQPQKTKTQRRQIFERKPQTDRVLHLAQHFAPELVIKSSISNHQRKKSLIQKFSKGQCDIKDKKLNATIHSSQNQVQKIIQKFKINFSAISILGVQQSEYRSLFFNARDSHFKKTTDLFNQMKFRNRFIAELIGQYDSGFNRYKQKTMRAKERQRKRHNSSSLTTTAQNRQKIGQSKSCQQQCVPSRKGVKLIKANNAIFGVNTKDRSCYTLYNYKSRKSNLSMTKNNQNQTQNLPNDLSLYEKTQRNILLNLGKVIFSGNKLELCPKSSGANQAQKKSRMVFYKRSRQYMRKKPVSNMERREIRTNQQQFNEQNLGLGMQISNYKK